ncbi:MAG: calcium/sodium antiporter [Gammaproteobacteria bacterium]|jgi:cation:H+ antiporter
MLLNLLFILAGFILLLVGADRFVGGAGATARNLGVPPLLIGLTIVGFATSAPEILVSVTAAVQGLPNLAIGNALGSNIANIGLVLGVSALVKPIYLSNSVTLRREMPLLLAVPIFTAIFFYTGDYLSKLDGLIMLAGLGVFLYWMARLGLRAARSDPMATEFDAEIRSDMRTSVAVAWLIVGFILLVAGSNLLVLGAGNLARALGVSHLFIGITIVAVGTSLPELAVTATCAFKGEAELALGNIIGSNIFNLLAVVGLAVIIHPVALDAEVLYLHFPVMIVFTVALFFMAYNKQGESRIRRQEGFVLLLAFVAYYGLLVARAF